MRRAIETDLFSLSPVAYRLSPPSVILKPVQHHVGVARTGGNNWPNVGFRFNHEVDHDRTGSRASQLDHWQDVFVLGDTESGATVGFGQFDEIWASNLDLG